MHFASGEWLDDPGAASQRGPAQREVGGYHTASGETGLRAATTPAPRAAPAAVRHLPRCRARERRPRRGRRFGPVASDRAPPRPREHPGQRDGRQRPGTLRPRAPAGRYTSTASGREVCRKYNAGTCRGWCRLEHVCHQCLGRHPAQCCHDPTTTSAARRHDPTTIGAISHGSRSSELERDSRHVDTAYPDHMHTYMLGNFLFLLLFLFACNQQCIHDMSWHCMLG